MLAHHDVKQIHGACLKRCLAVDEIISPDANEALNVVEVKAKVSSDAIVITRQRRTLFDQLNVVECRTVREQGQVILLVCGSSQFFVQV
jgi:hypothetical protein